MANAAPALVLSGSQKSALEGFVRNGATPQRLASRCRALLLAGQGVANQAIAKRLHLSRPTILALREAFVREGLAAVTRTPRRNRRRSVVTPELELKIIHATVKRRPSDSSISSVRGLAAEFGVSPATVHRLWRRHDLQPRRAESLRISDGPGSQQKVCYLAGLFLDPLLRAAVLSTEGGRRTGPDVASNFAALKLLHGRVIGHGHEGRAPAQRFTEFLDQVAAELPPGREAHVVLHDNVRAGLQFLADHKKRFEFRVIPTANMWLKQVHQTIRGEAFDGAGGLEKAIYRWLADWNGEPASFIWRASGKTIRS